LLGIRFQIDAAEFIQQFVEFIEIDRTVAALDTLLVHLVRSVEVGPEVHPILGKTLALMGEFQIPGGLACFDPSEMRVDVSQAIV